MEKKIVKVTTPWRTKFLYNTIDKPNMYESQSRHSNCILGNLKFEVNNDVKECDYWFIYGGLTVGDLKMTVKCPTQNIFYITDETHHNRFFVKKFLDQFPSVITCRTDLDHRNILKYHEILIWYLDKTFDELEAIKHLPKTKGIAIINSNLTETPLQRKRYELTHKLIGHFKDRIDVFGRGHQTFKDKWEILKDYKYTIAIENTVQPGYFTEKISECYLTHTFPLYYGCPDINQYYDPESMEILAIDDYKKCIQQIEKILSEDKYEDHLPALIAQKQKYLNEYHFFPALAKLINLHGTDTQIKKKHTIYKEDYFKRLYWLRHFIQLLNNRKILGKYTFYLHLVKEARYANK
jgi:hypothetical protein